MRILLLLLAIIRTIHSLSTSISEVYRKYDSFSPDKHYDERISICAMIQEVKCMSPRLVFLRVQDHNDNNVEIELLLRERDSFLSKTDIANITEHATTAGAILHCQAFPETLSSFDGPSFFPELPPLNDGQRLDGICLHVVAANVSLPNGELMTIVPQERQITTVIPGNGMPPLQQTSKNKHRSRGGARNRDRGGVFAAWAIDTFPNLDKILDVAGGSGQLAFQFGVRRGYNITVIDPRPLKLSLNQQRTLEYQRKVRTELDEGDPSLPPSDYGYYFSEEDGRWLVGRNGAYVRHLAKWFDGDFAQHEAFQKCSVILGMHPDEATEDIVDLALQNKKPFAIAPCCVFWRLSPHRRLNNTQQVRTYEQFCEYLVAKDPQRIQQVDLPFPGRNRVLYCLGY